ncbi:alpha/beta fold hydrolase [Runella sp.]|uniref:alpha/beta fold hydrolase n=1 Tax=Runella sp. TaxID=1960881 RepID=UPI003D0B206A
MKIYRTSHFKNPALHHQWFEKWVARLESLNQKKYERIIIETSLGKTHVWGLHTSQLHRPPLVIFPGARTTALFWDLDNGLSELEENYRIYLVETNGLPNLSDGHTPDIKSLGYGEWASEVLDKLHISKATIAGASFGGLICMKLCIVAPSTVESVFLLNPGCLQPFSLSLKNLYYNLLPILFPTRKNVATFLNKAVFCKPTHELPDDYEGLLIAYEVFALKYYKDNTQKPYYMDDELKEVASEVYLIEGDHDLLFPYKTSVQNAKEKLSGLKEVIILPNVGHGIETFKGAISVIAEKTQHKFIA